MIPLILFILLIVLVVVLTEIRERRKQNSPAAEEANRPQDGCCDQHLVCEWETLLQTNAKIEYYDDEELDKLADIDPATYTPEQHEAIRQVFNTLLERDVPGWCRSLQLRHIQLPADIREEALMIVRERRHL